MVFDNKASADTNPKVEELQATYAPRFAAHRDAIRLDPVLDARISAVHDDRAGLDPDQRYLVERYYTELTLEGAGLPADEKEVLKDLNARLSSLHTTFEQALNADSNDLALVVDDAAELDGLAPGEISAAAAVGGRAWARRQVRHHPATADRPPVPRRRSPTGTPGGACPRRSAARGSRGNAHDTRETLLEIVRLRAERAKVLGFESHAAGETANNTAGTPQAARDLMERLAAAAAPKAVEEQQALEAHAGLPIEPWDWPFYAEQVRTATYEVDLAALRPYFESEKVLQDGVFLAATRLYGITFTERPDLVGYHPDVRVFEVHEEDGRPVGLYLLDLYTRDSKNGGAWMNSLVDQSDLLESPTAVVVNNLNVAKPAPGEPTLLGYDETRTLFHEFGHALHGLLARVRYPSAAGTAVFRDFVEFPSQVNEMWMLWPEVLAEYAVHHETGEPIPAEVLEQAGGGADLQRGLRHQ